MAAIRGLVRSVRYALHEIFQRRFVDINVTLRGATTAQCPGQFQVGHRLRRLDGLEESVEKASLARASHMQLLDGKRSIQEAQSVTRMTELAFLFIPLSCAASIFGMQVDSFDPPLSISAFLDTRLGVDSCRLRRTIVPPESRCSQT